MSGYLVPDRAYDVLKWLGLLALPALATFTATVGPAWGLDAGVVDAVVTTLNAAGVLVGALLGASAASAKGGSNA